MTSAEARACRLSAAAKSLLLSVRQRPGDWGHDRTLRLARTVADLAGKERVCVEELTQALELRRSDRG